VTACRVAVADRTTVNPELLHEIADRHRREES
jgi:hypothetical protein